MTTVFERRLLMLSLIPRAPRSASTAAIREALQEQGYEVSKRQVQKDLQDAISSMQELGLCYYIAKEMRECAPEHQEEYDDEAEEKRRHLGRWWYMRKTAPVLELHHMDPDAALAFSLAEKYLRDLLPETVFQNIDHYFARARYTMDKAPAAQRWCDSVAIVNKALPLLRPVILEAVETQVYKALQLGRQLRLKAVTRRHPDMPKSYTVNPLGLVYRDPLLYLVWTDADPEHGNKVKELVLSRMTEAEALPDAREVPPGFSLQAFIDEAKGFGYFIDPSTPYIDLEILAQPSLTFSLKETPLSMDQVIHHPDAEGWSRITARVAYTHQLTAWIREKGYEIRVMAPDALRHVIIGQIRKMNQNYV